jgi:hypothetical protein
MAFRTEAKACAGLILLAVCSFAVEPRTYSVRHKHLHNGGTGILKIDEHSVSFEEPGKRSNHSRVWKYDDIQELTLGRDTLRIVTYEDNRLELGRDRVYLFDRLPSTLAADWYPVFRAQLDERFVAALADNEVKPEWQMPVKLLHARAGSQGFLLVGTDRVVYSSGQPGESRTWRIGDLENVSSADRFDLTVTTHEREFRFQLKQALDETRYQELWMRVNRARGLQILNGTPPAERQQALVER